MSVNIVILSGRFAKDPEIRYTKKDMPVGTFTLAVNEGKDSTEFIRCRCFKKTAEFVNQYCSKGAAVIVVGKWHNFDYEKDGKKVYGTECTVNNISFQTGKAVSARDADTPFEEIADDVELPF